MTISIASSKLLVRLQPNLQWTYSIISRSVLWKTGVTAFKQDQGHCEGLKCQWMFVRTLSSQSQNILLPNLVWWCSIISQNVMRKCFVVVAILKVTVTARVHDYDKNMTLTIFSELLTSWQPNLGWWNIIISQSGLRKNWITAFKIDVTAKGQNVNVCPDVIL